MSNIWYESKEQSWLDAPEWMYEAACLGLPTDWFFAEDTSAHPPRRNTSPEELLIGLGVCQNCRVKTTCLEEAIADRSLDFGIRGGTTSKQRQAIRRKRRK